MHGIIVLALLLCMPMCAMFNLALPHFKIIIPLESCIDLVVSLHGL